MTLRALSVRLLRCRRGAMAIETALVAPVLAMMSIGTFEVGTMVSRQQELQSAASEAEGIILAAATGPGADSGEIELVIEDSMNLNTDQVELTQRFRCNSAAELIVDGTTCDPARPTYRYVRLVMTDTYAPVWARFGVGSDFDYNIERTILVQ